VRALAISAALLLAGCAANPLAPPMAKAPAIDECRAEVGRLNALLAAEVAERQRLTRGATRREDAMRRQLDAMKAIERSILEREDRVRSESR
jgi:outer membrane murein-binding lipoprotein Lpp